jgi:hypothetical protein
MILHRHFKTQLFVISLFNDSVLSAKFKQCAINDRMIVSRKLVIMWEGMAMGFCRILFQHLPGGTEEDHKEILQVSPLRQHSNS